MRPPTGIFVQLARGVSATEEALVSEGVAPSTLRFSDRPDSVVGHMINEHRRSRRREF